MNNKFLKISLFVLPLLLFFIFSILIYLEYTSYKIINKNISFTSFIKSNIYKVLSFDINSKRIKIVNISKKFYNKDDFIDNGFLLVSGYNIDHKTSTVTLFSLKEKKILHSWIPPISEIHINSPNYTKEYNLKKNYRMQHPLLTDNGDIIFSSGEGPLVKLDKCGNLKWSVNRHFHHSIELYDKNSIIAPIVLDNNLNKSYPILNHGFALVDIENGSLIKEYSIIKILEDNNKIGLLYGVGEFEYDRVHLNDAEAIKANDEFVKKGDIMLSSKHLSTVLLYRPYNNKIVWLKTGPWLNQHDIDYLGNGIFSIFGNDTFRYNQMENHDVFIDNNNKIYIYDFKDDSIKTLYDNTMIEVKTPTQGLHEILKNGDVFIEDTDNFKLLRLNKENIRWEYFNFLGDNKIGSIHWSRYLAEDHNLDWINNLNC